jgi:hypothetical protein
MNSHAEKAEVTTNDYTVGMATPRSIRFDARTLERLSTYAARRPGLSASSAAAMLVEEALRMDEHPGVIFSDGPAGRRALLATGPDVWEIVKAVRDARLSEPDLKATDLTELVVTNTGVTKAQLKIALAYYGSFADEIDEQVKDADRAESDLELSMSRTRELFGS